jgi:hypothetical protein
MYEIFDPHDGITLAVVPWRWLAHAIAVVLKIDYDKMPCT